MNQIIKIQKSNDFEWAHESIKDLLFNSALNIILKQSGFCSNYICDMNEKELEDYIFLLKNIHKN